MYLDALKYIAFNRSFEKNGPLEDQDLLNNGL